MRIEIERIQPRNPLDVRRYIQLLNEASLNPAVVSFLPGVLEVRSYRQAQRALGDWVACFFVKVDGVDAGRLALSNDFNTDPSVVTRTPDSVRLGFNTCYFLNDSLVEADSAKAHRIIAMYSIREAFKVQGDPTLSPWTQLTGAVGVDPSRGWAYLADRPADEFDVSVGEPQLGWFPQFEMGNQALRLAYATAHPNVSSWSSRDLQSTTV
ncbi:MAG TPA: hypothetical protein VGS28_01925 [Candidatus Saccharimonadales bacterium]|nr:hypothetical protein [Candidatus Saccharimonadales bacterium]